MSRQKPTFAALALAGLIGAAPPAAAQSLLGANGLGMPLASLDARATTLGGVGIGLRGGSLSATDPAAAADLTVPGVVFTFQTSWVDGTLGDATRDYSGTRFPLIAASYPARGIGTLSIGFGSVFDQRWRSEQQGILDLEGTEAEARVTDTFVSDGGVSAVRVGIARRLSPSLALGVQVGSHLGEVTRVFTRTFDSLEVETSIPSYQIGGLWTYSGLTASVGAAVDLGQTARVAASYTWSGELDAEPSDDTDGAGDSFDLPGELRVGATAVLSQALALNAAIHRADWSGVFGGSGAAVGRSVLSYGGGVEWTDATILGKPGAVRLGYRRVDLPFGTEEAPEPRESAFSAGLGMDLLRSGTVALANVSFSLERGSREAGALEESFWRLATSFRVSGF